jgi:tetratricopeptide (TPR) repeat protein
MSRQLRSPIIDDLYQQYLSDQDESVLATSIAERYSIGSLERLLASGNRTTRRAAALAIGMLGDYESNAALGRALSDSDRNVRNLAENGIRALWCRVGNEADRCALSQLIRLNSRRQFLDVVRQATALTHSSPSVAEAWNQRAIAFFNLKRFDESIRDCAQTLEMNPYHYGASSGMGQGYLHMGNRAAALECFERAIRLNPDLEGVRLQIRYLKRLQNNSDSGTDR